MRRIPQNTNAMKGVSTPSALDAARAEEKVRKRSVDEIRHLVSESSHSALVHHAAME